MILVNINNKKIYTEDFVKAIIDNQLILKRFIMYLDLTKLNVMQVAAQTIFNEPKLDLYNICVDAIKNSIILESNDSFQIIVDPNLRLGKHSINSILSFINFGNLDFPQAYPIFTIVQNNIEEDLPNLIDDYENMGILL